MPRKSPSLTQMIVSYFMSAPIIEADRDLEVAHAIVRSRHAQGLKAPALPLRADRPARVRKPKPPQQSVLPADPSLVPAAPVAAPAPTPPRVRRARKPVAATTATTTTAPAAVPDQPAGTRPLPEQTAGDQE